MKLLNGLQAIQAELTPNRTLQELKLEACFDLRVALIPPNRTLQELKSIQDMGKVPAAGAPNRTLQELKLAKKEV